MKKILIIEDNESIIKGLKYSLEQEGFNVTVRNKCKRIKEYFRKTVNSI